jgi:hypothetical protein
VAGRGCQGHRVLVDRSERGVLFGVLESAVRKCGTKHTGGFVHACTGGVVRTSTKGRLICCGMLDRDTANNMS